MNINEKENGKKNFEQLYQKLYSLKFKFNELNQRFNIQSTDKIKDFKDFEKNEEYLRYKKTADFLYTIYLAREIFKMIFIGKNMKLSFLSNRVYPLMRIIGVTQLYYAFFVFKYEKV
jgi:hypothetical protein